MLLKSLFILLVGLLSFPTLSFASYAVGAFSQDNSIEEFVDSEKKFGIKYQVIAFTFDTFNQSDAVHLETAIKTLGKDRVYHVSISPFGLSAKQVANGEYNESYKRFFELVKKSEAKFVFRTMHEMNGSWYSWSGDPENFKKAWRHIHSLSRSIGLSQSQILFVLSSNSQDLPSKDGVINGQMIFCSPAARLKTSCIAMEDYYPGAEYVDLMGITLYNWGRGRYESWATWRSFENLLIDPKTKMFERISSYGHPVFIDEVGTTAVNFSGPWSEEKVRNAYQNDTETKNTWLRELKLTLHSHPQIVGVVYFNRDKTYGLTDRSQIGELDWATSSVHIGKVYNAYFDFFKDPLCTPKALPFARGYGNEDARLYAAELSKKTLIGSKSFLNNKIKRKKILEQIKVKITSEKDNLNKKISTAKSKEIKGYWEAVLKEFQTITDKEFIPNRN